MGKQSKLVTCKHCGEEIAANAKACPKCGGKNKKPIYKRPWFIVLAVLVVIGAISSMGGKKDELSDVTSNTNSIVENATEKEVETDAVVEAEEEPRISYTAYSVSELMDDLKSNSMKATDKYKKQYVELTGKLNVIDSSGKYISITPVDDEFAIIGVQCYIKSDEQKSAIMDMSMGDTVVVKGKITSVGEVMGYSLDIDEISK